ncbi:hypothetical protein ACVW0Y_001245 [Pseudomonas sp. TE3786]
MYQLKITGLTCLLGLLAACAQQPYLDESLPLEERLALLGLRQGDAVNSIAGININGWQPLDTRHITLDAGVGRDYLIVFSRPCYNLNANNRIGYSASGGTLTRFDKIVSIDNGMRQSCPIGDIYLLEKLAKPAT